ncbi:MoaD/ThiS family protein [Fusibacter ferrireducens]|uniref:MoaD/ThiS family protein n=1 Tax=Fusibacter ferrireducens TaxID=2785058 RepID=A0ABR9ZR35_9FIRM|nr:MoaD/ThiS family protein [Fusibacter ferrireducens]MBF4692920.1 MoaD/ThiS family protein [Fusibacter ferrireducens]
MEIKVRLFATLREGRGKEIMVSLGDNPTTQMIIDQLNIKAEDVAILLINGRDGSMSKVLEETDVVSIFPPVGGG